MIGTWGLFALAACSDFALEKVAEPPVDGERVLTVSPGLLDYGVVSDNAATTDVVSLTASGSLPVRVDAVTVTGSAAYTLDWPEGTAPIEPGETLDLVVTYTPASHDDQAEIVVASDATEPRQVVALVGAGHYPAIAIAPASVSLESGYGESVDAQVQVTSVGTADLELASMYVEGAQFSVAGRIPVTLPPGESIPLDVRYTPEVAGESVDGKIWLTTNTAAGFALVPLLGAWRAPCIGLGEAWDRGLLQAETLIDGITLELTNLSDEESFCVDGWYVYLAEQSQDLGAGDMDADFGDPYPEGSLEIGPGERMRFDAAGTSGPAWWCMEKAQYTDRMKPYDFLGTYVPEPLLGFILAEDQDGVWDWMAANPVLVPARSTNYLRFSRAGGEAAVTVRALNMGGQAGDAELRETVPAGWSASDFSVAPDRVEAGDEGATVYVWDVSLEARVERGASSQTLYDEVAFSYLLAVPSCHGRLAAPLLSSTWLDATGETRIATANPLIVHCEDESP